MKGFDPLKILTIVYTLLKNVEFYGLFPAAGVLIVILIIVVIFFQFIISNNFF